MPRQARYKGEFTTYHIIQRGNEGKSVFASDDDRLRFLDTLARMKEKYNFLVYAYCLMDNHLHLVIDDNGNDISKLIKSLNVSYVYYFNQKYNRCGHLFQDRFRSEIIYDDKYLLQVSKYIHNNPVKAGLVKTAGEYSWSSYNVYTGRYNDTRELLATDKILGIISNRRGKAVKAYVEYVAEEEILQVMDIQEEIAAFSVQNRHFIRGIGQAKEKMRLMAGEKGLSPEELLQNRAIRNEIMAEIRKNSSLSLKQIGEVFGGLSESRVSRILKKRES